MTPERLLELYDRISEAPDAVARLRRFVLDLAVRGKLVEQDPEDEPASELMKSVVERKTELGVRRKTTPVAPEQVPFNLPSQWVWSRIGAICSKTGSGSTPRGGKQVYLDSGIPFLRSQNVYNEGLRLEDVAYIDQSTHERMKGTKVFPGDLLLNITGGSIGRCCYVPDDFTEANVSQHVAILRAAVGGVGRFLHLLVLSPYFQSFIFDEQTGAGRGGLPKNRMDEIVVALPPLTEQQRIVAKVDDLMALCDRLEDERARREALRDSLTTASLGRLSAPDSDPEALRANSRFALDSLAALTASPDQIKTLRQTILNLAVRGKLTRQNPEDEDAIAVEDGLGTKEVKPFEIPHNWRWARLKDLGKLVGGGTPSKARDDFWNGDIPWVAPKDMKVDYIAKSQMSISKEAVAESSVNLIEPESVLFVVRGMILAHSFPVAISRTPLTINQDMKAIVLDKPELAEYVLRALKGLKAEMLARVQRSSHGTCRIEGTAYKNFLVPVPPLAEQQRIVAKVDELMALCDQLEASLTAADTTRASLLEAVLHEALAPATEVSEAAE